MSQHPKINYCRGRSSEQQHAPEVRVYVGGGGVCLLMSQHPKIKNCMCVYTWVGCQVSNNVPATVGGLLYYESATKNLILCGSVK